MPILIFLHGLLGTQADWQKLIEKLPHFRCIALDLPWHGTARHVQVSDFGQTCDYLAQRIESAVGNRPFFLVGYSLGGRIALYYALRARCDKGDLLGVIAEGAHLGLQSIADRQARWRHDQMWAGRFSNEPAERVLKDWYRQPVFAHLTDAQRADLIAKRAAGCGTNIGKMLLATSLAKQPDFRADVRSNSLPVYYVVGERDQKFKQMAADHRLHFSLIKDAGHNAHWENPQTFADKLTALCLP